jgi:hypothetical protein
MHFSYTPLLCPALSYVNKVTANELHSFKFYINKLIHSSNPKYLLQYENIFNYNKQSNNTILFLPLPSQCQGHFKQIRNLKLIISIEVTCFHLHFLHSTKCRFYSTCPSLC